MSLPNPKISVVMAVHNNATFLARAIESILNQTLADFEFIIVNDGSSDGSEEIIRRFADPRIRVLEQSTHSGLALSLNRGINEAGGLYIARQDAKDISLPNRLEIQAARLDAEPELALVGTFFVAINEKDEIVQEFHLPIENADIKRRLPTRNCFAHGSVCFRKEWIKQIGSYRPVFERAQDYDLWLRLSEKHLSANIPEFLYQWRMTTPDFSLKRRYRQVQYTKLAQQCYWERQKAGTDSVNNGTWKPAEPLAGQKEAVLAAVEEYNYGGLAALLNDQKLLAWNAFKKAAIMRPFHILTYGFVLLFLLKCLVPEKIFRKIFFMLTRAWNRYIFLSCEKHD